MHDHTVALLFLYPSSGEDAKGIGFVRQRLEDVLEHDGDNGHVVVDFDSYGVELCDPNEITP
jgi:hypothetical protein